ncbi:small ribosomal subunit protein uS15m [Phymastichus coffea]|uniref:small ribosomal subunit protein uS15m n=1 Tax=Phymastichus coffea TaxID=108790 RepID=UPI00273C8A3E|nr:small ribosomal subunit protein uS15m [Phymastichus coffea]XP_058794491.1 small ribosomal subunit protein uS15m [Phymastichus coffea]
MNILRQLSLTPNIVRNLIQTRNYAVPKLPVEWIEPEKISCIDPRKSGDGGLELNIKPEDPIKFFEKSEELKGADSIVKKIFSINFNNRKSTVYLQKERAIQLVQRHSHDRGSMEAKIAKMTVRILQLQEHQKIFWQNKKTKRILKELIDKRNKCLKFLRRQDYPRFEFLLERLNLIYKPCPEDKQPLDYKSCTTRLMEKYCDKIVKEKLANYRQELESQQASFFKEKAEKLEFIRNEEIACGVTPTISEEEIEAAKQKAASFVN